MRELRMMNQRGDFPRLPQFFLVALLVSLSSCSWLLSHVRPSPPTLFTSYPNTASFGATLACVQKIKVLRDSESQVFLAQLEIDERKLTLVAYTPFQTRAFTLSYDSDLSFMPGPGIKLDLDPNFFLTDLTLALWPLQALTPLLTSSTSIQEQPLRRTVISKGEVLLQIDYTNQIAWRGKLLLRNVRYGYSLEIESVDCT